MTERLYYGDAYLTSFEAVVLSCEPADGGWAVRLDRSAFYPTSGGQPFDTGRLGGAAVVDVSVDGAGEVLHTVDAPLDVGGTVEGRVDWARRFDHMQQHAGEHMLAGALHALFGGHTIGLHLGAEDATIDVELPGGRMRLEADELCALECAVNAQIQSNHAIRCYFPTAGELACAPLRKPPAVHEHIRLVQIGDVECVACGGTHPRASGEIGLVKVLDARPSRGKMRVTFVCGMRAMRHYQLCARALNDAAARLSARAETLSGAVERTLERLCEAERACTRLQLDAAAARAEALLPAAAVLWDGRTAVISVLGGLERDALLHAAAHLCARGAYALLASDAGEGAGLVFAAPEGAPLDMGNLLGRAARPLGGKGGGRRELAQGAGPGLQVLDAAKAILTNDYD